MTGGAGLLASGANGSGAGKGGGTAGLTLLCPNCGTRRPLFYYRRRNASAKDGGAKSRTRNCAICRGYTPVDPNQVQDGDDDDDDDDDGGDDDEDEGDGEDDDNSEGSPSSSEDDFVYDKDKPRKKKNNVHIRPGHHGHTGDLYGTRGSNNDLRHLQQLTQYMDQLNNFGGGDVSHLPEESDWILTGMGVVLYFFGWASIVTLFVVIVAF